LPVRSTSAQRTSDVVEFEEPCSTPATRSPTQRGPAPTTAPSGLSVCAEPAPAAVPLSTSAVPMHAARQPAEVTLDVYYQRAVAFENGRVRTGMRGPALSMAEKAWKDMIGVYHVGVAVRGVEYAFGMSRGYNSRRLGSLENGVFVHEVQRAGPGNVFKQAVGLGTTQLSAEQVEDVARNLGESLFVRTSYNRIHHNCVDFAKHLCKALGAQEPPSWSYRGANIAKTLGMGDQVKGADEAEDEEGGAVMANSQVEAATEVNSAAFDPVAQPLPPQLHFAQTHHPMVGANLALSPQLQQLQQLPQLQPAVGAHGLPLQHQLQPQVRSCQAVEVPVEVVVKSQPAEAKKHALSTEFDQDNVTEL